MGSPSQGRFEKELLALARAFPDMRARFEFLYGNLNVLDSKASFLLGFNAIALAAVAVWLEDVEPNVFHLILDAVFLAFLASSFSCLWAIAMHWSSANDLLKAFPEQNELPPAHTPLIEELLEIRDERTRWFRRSRVVSLLGMSVGAEGEVQRVGLHALEGGARLEALTTRLNETIQRAEKRS